MTKNSNRAAAHANANGYAKTYGKAKMCDSNQGKRVFGKKSVSVECVKCGWRFLNSANVGNLPHHPA